MRAIFIFLATLALLGCATSREVYTPDGQKGHSINCSGNALNWGMCYEKAGELCGEKGYNIMAKSGDTGAVVTANQYGLYGGSVINRSLVIQCKN